nr:MAG TPA: hypothetical protein [Caudoviricetes sp.]DAP25144.1 MAG TPA: hypothetical protein [Caudoviricetes sp.]
MLGSPRWVSFKCVLWRFRRVFCWHYYFNRQDQYFYLCWRLW